MNLNKENLRHNSKEIFKFFVELVKVAFISLAIIIPVRYFLIQPFYVKGASMEPNFHDKEYLIINEIGYRVGEPIRGDIVVFRYPKDPSNFFIKRIIALPGEKVMVENGEITIYNDENVNGTVLDESDYLPAGVTTSGKVEYQLESDEYFVLGDNRNSSLDSRSFGPISEDYIIGRAWLRGWPLNKITVFDRLIYNL